MHSTRCDSARRTRAWIESVRGHQHTSQLTAPDSVRPEAALVTECNEWRVISEGERQFGRPADRLRLRVARLDDIPELNKLIAASVRGLQNSDYSQAQIEGAIGSVYGTDRTMIGDGTFFVVEDGLAIIGCGGWSRRRTAFGSDDSPVKDDSPLDPQS